MDIFAGLQLGSLEIPRLCKDPNAWRYTVIGHDSASANILCNRYLAAELDIYPRLLPIFQPCFSHVVSGSAQHSHPEVDFSDLSKVAHLLNKKDFSLIKDYCRELFSEAEIVRPYQVPNIVRICGLRFSIKSFRPTGHFSRKTGPGGGQALCAGLRNIFH